MKRRGSLAPFILIFGGTGVLLLAIAAFLFVQRAQFVGDALSADGVVVGFEKRATSMQSAAMSDRYISVPVVEFTDRNGNKVRFTESTGGVGNDALRKGDSVTVFYDPEQPASAKLATFFHLWAAVLVVGALGLVFFIIGFMLFFVPFLQRRRRLQLQRNGLQTAGEIVSIKENRKITVGGKHPVQLEVRCCSPDSGKELVLTSHSFWDQLIPESKGKKVNVYIDPKRPDRYFVDPAAVIQWPD